MINTAAAATIAATIAATVKTILAGLDWSNYEVTEYLGDTMYFATITSDGTLRLFRDNRFGDPAKLIWEGPARKDRDEQVAKIVAAEMRPRSIRAAKGKARHINA